MISEELKPIQKDIQLTLGQPVQLSRLANCK